MPRIEIKDMSGSWPVKTIYCMVCGKKIEGKIPRVSFHCPDCGTELAYDSEIGKDGKNHIFEMWNLTEKI